MTTEAKTPETQTTSTATPVTIETASFADYERLRRGEKIEAPAASAPAAPTEETQKEQKESTDSATEETEDKESDTEGKSPQDEGESENDEEPKPEAATKKKGGFQRRIDKLNGRNAALQQRLEVLESLLAKNAGGAKSEAPKVDTATASTDEGKPNPDNYNTHAEYVEAVAEWQADKKVEQKLAERDKKAEQARLADAQKAAAQTYSERVKAFTAKTPDFTEVMADADDVPMSQVMQQAMLESEHGPALAYELAKNPEEAARIAGLHPISAAREMGKLEAKIAARASEAKSTEPKKTTQAPKPIEPVGGAKSTGVHKTLEDMNFSEYEQARRKQMNSKRA